MCVRAQLAAAIWPAASSAMPGNPSRAQKRGGARDIREVVYHKSAQKMRTF